MRVTSGFSIIASFLGGLVLLFVIAPLVGMLISTPANEILTATLDKDIQQSIYFTLGIAIAGTLCFAVLSIPFAYLLARRHFFGKKIICAIIDLPLIIPHTAAGIALLSVSTDIFPKIAFLKGLNFSSNPFGIALAMGFVSVPFLINFARSGFENVPIKLEKAAKSLGASSFRVFMSISLPLAWRNVLSGMVMMFSRGISEFGAVVIVAYYPMVTSTLIFEKFYQDGLSGAKPVSIVFIAVCLVFYIIVRMLSRKFKIPYRKRKALKNQQ